MATARVPWTDEELAAAVDAYLEMAERYRSGKEFMKKRYFEDLARRFPRRTVKAFEWRMQNISHVLSLLGLAWLPGLRPARNTGRQVAGRIEALLANRLGRSWLIEVADVLLVQKEAAKLRRKPRLPAGQARPIRQETSVLRYRRDPRVAAWVLLNAGGHCEACGKAAPFVDAAGRPFLEVHHVVPLAEGGSDTVDNVVAVCPNCHRELHFGKDAWRMRQRLLRHVREPTTPGSR